MNILNRVKVINWLREYTNSRNTALGAVTSALFCPICFPALAGVASALGLSFLTKYEGIFLIFFFVFMSISLYSIWSGFRQHKVKLPLLISGAGALLILGSFFQLIPIYSFIYVGLALLIIGAFINAHHTKKYSDLNCNCEPVAE